MKTSDDVLSNIVKSGVKEKSTPDFSFDLYSRLFRDLNSTISKINKPRFLDKDFLQKDFFVLKKAYNSFFGNTFSYFISSVNSVFKDFKTNLVVDFPNFGEIKLPSKSDIDKTHESIFLRTFKRAYKLAGIGKIVDNIFKDFSSSKKSAYQKALLIRDSLNQTNEEFFSTTYTSAQRVRRRLNNSFGNEGFTDLDTLNSFYKTMWTGFTDSQREDVAYIQAMFTKLGDKIDINSNLIKTFIRANGSHFVRDFGKRISAIYQNSIASFSTQALSLSELYLTTYIVKDFNVDPSLLQAGALSAEVYKYRGLDPARGLKHQRYLLAYKNNLSLSKEALLTDELYSFASKINFGSLEEAALANTEDVAVKNSSLIQKLATTQPQFLQIFGLSWGEIYDLEERGRFNSSSEELKVLEDKKESIIDLNSVLIEKSKSLKAITSIYDEILNQFLNGLSDSGLLPELFKWNFYSGLDPASQVIFLLSSILDTMLFLATPKALESLGNIWKKFKTTGPDKSSYLALLPFVPSTAIVLDKTQEFNFSSLVSPDKFDKGAIINSLLSLDTASCDDIIKNAETLRTLSKEVKPIDFVLSEGDTWVKKSDVSFSGLQDVTKQGLTILSKWFYDRTGNKLLVTSGTDSTNLHAAGARSHAAGVKLDVADDWFLDKENREEFINYAESLGVVVLDEYSNPSIRSTGGHLDLDFTDLKSNDSFVVKQKPKVKDKNKVFLNADGIPVTEDYGYREMAHEIVSAIQSYAVLNDIEDIGDFFILEYKVKENEIKAQLSGGIYGQ